MQGVVAGKAITKHGARGRHKKKMVPSKKLTSPRAHISALEQDKRITASLRAERHSFQSIVNPENESMLKPGLPNLDQLNQNFKTTREMFLAQNTESQSFHDSPSVSQSELEDEFYQNFYGRFVHPQGPFKIKWDLTLAALIIYSTLVVPFRIAFDVEPSVSSPAYVIDWMIDTFFFCDICLNFRTGFLDMEDQLVIEAWSVALHYLKGWFTVDFLSTFPFDWVGKQMIPGGNSAVLRSSKLLRILRLFRLLKLVRLLKLGRIIGSSEEGTTLNPSIVGLCKMFLQLIFIAHLLGCLWHWTAILQDPDAFTWVTFYGVENTTILHRYLISVYWAFTTMTTVGYGDIKPANDFERAIVIIGMLIGASVFGYVIGNVTAMMDEFDKKSAGYKELMDKVMDYMQEKKFPPNLRKKVRAHCKYYYKKINTMNMHLDVERPMSFMAATPACTLLFASKHYPVQKFTFLQDSSPLFVAGMVQVMKPCSCEVNEVLFVENEIGVQLFMLAEGEVQFYMKRKRGLSNRRGSGFDYVRFSRLYHDHYFGEAPLVLDNILQPISAATTRPCELYTVEKEDLLGLLDRFPCIDESMATKAEKFLTSVENFRKTLLRSEAEVKDSFNESLLQDPERPQEKSFLQQSCRRRSIIAQKSKRRNMSLVDEIGSQSSLLGAGWNIPHIVDHTTPLQSEPTSDGVPEVESSPSFQNNPSGLMHFPEAALESQCGGNSQVVMDSVTSSEVAFRDSRSSTFSNKAKLGAILPKSRIPTLEALNDTSSKRGSQYMMSDANAPNKLNDIGGLSQDAVTQDNRQIFNVQSPELQIPENPRAQDFINASSSLHADPVNRTPSMVRRASLRITKGLSNKMLIRKSSSSTSAPSMKRKHSSNPDIEEKHCVDQDSKSQDEGKGSDDKSTHSAAFSQRSQSSSLRFKRVSKKALFLKHITSFMSSYSSRRRFPRDGAVHPTISFESREKRKLLQKSRGSVVDSLFDFPDRLQVSLLQIPPDKFFACTKFFHPTSMSKSLWDIFVGLLIIFSVVEVTYRLAFNVPAEGNWKIFSYMMDILFASDMLITFRTAIYIEHNIIISQRTVAQNYLKSWFFIDFASTVPFDLIFGYFFTGTGDALRSTKLIKSMRLIRLVKVVRLIKMSTFFQKYEDLIPVNPTVIRFVKLVLIMTFAAHLYGCVFYAITVYGQNENESWVTAYCINEVCLDELNVGAHYLAALYWAFTTMTTVGYGDILPTHRLDEIVVTFVSQVSATTLFAYVIGALVSLVLNVSPGEKNRKAAVMDFNCYLSDLTLTSQQMKGLRRQYNHRVMTKPVYLQEQEEFLCILPMHLRIKVVYFLYRQPLKKLPFFAQFEDKYRGFLSIVMPRLKPCLFSPGEHIVTQFVPAREMYFVVKGRCYARSTRENTFYRTYQESDHFAEATMLVADEAMFVFNYTVKAHTRAQIYAMSKDVLDDMILFYPHISKSFIEQIITDESKAEITIIPFKPRSPPKPHGETDTDAETKPTEWTRRPSLDAAGRRAQMKKQQSMSSMKRRNSKIKIGGARAALMSQRK